MKLPLAPTRSNACARWGDFRKASPLIIRLATQQYDRCQPADGIMDIGPWLIVGSASTRRPRPCLAITL
jgi:hypothetical protein